MPQNPTPNPPSAESVARLVSSHREFLKFLSKRVPDPSVAEEILQAAFVRSLERGGAIHDSESAVAWFYRLLRNALVDYHRRSSTESRAMERHCDESTIQKEDELRDVVCSCVTALLPNLKPEYAEILRRVDLLDMPLPQAASELAITPNNATVRLHRARQALKRQLESSCGTCASHGCFDCSCGQNAGGCSEV